MKKYSLVLLGLIIVFSFDVAAQKGGNGKGGNTNTYITVANFQGDFEDSDAWQNGNIPSDFVNIDKEMTIYGTITRNGSINPVTVTVNGIFNVSGDYLNNQWGGITIESGATVEIFGDLEGSAGISVNKGGTLIIHGNLSSTGSSFKTNGDVVVKGDFSTSSSTQVQNKGNLVVGGDFSHLGGGLNGHSDDIYILNPDATIINPGWGIINKGDYGDLDGFLENEKGSDLLDLVDELVLNPVNKWVGNKDSNWSNKENWKNKQTPDINSTVKIEATEKAPVIDGDVTIGNLIISKDASVIVKPGARMEVVIDVTNNGLFVLESESDNLASLMLPENVSKAGNANVKLTLPNNHYWYLSTPLKNAEAGWFKPTEVADKDYVYVFEVVNNRWQWIRLGQDDVDNQRKIAPLQGITAYYYDNAKNLDYTGELNNEEVVKEFDDRGFHLVGNPFPTAIDWSWKNSEGWERDGFSNTIWSWVTIGEERVVQTYNGEFDVLTPQIEGYSSEKKGYISPYQSVWVKQVDNTATMKIKKSAQVHDNSAPLKSVSSQDSEHELIRVRAENEYALDETVLFFKDGFNSSRGTEDAEKRFNSSSKIPEVYTRINSGAYTLNGQPALSDGYYSFSLSVRNRVEGDVKLSVNLNEFNSNYEVILEDKETGSWVNMRELSEYVYTPVKMGEDHERFVLHLEKMQQVATSVETNNFSNKKNISILGQKDYALVQISSELLRTSNAVIEVLDINGRLMKSLNTRSAETEVELPSTSGVYVIRINAGSVVKTVKVVR